MVLSRSVSFRQNLYLVSLGTSSVHFPTSWLVMVDMKAYMHVAKGSVRLSDRCCKPLCFCDTSRLKIGTQQHSCCNSGVCYQWHAETRNQAVSGTSWVMTWRMKRSRQRILTHFTLGKSVIKKGMPHSNIPIQPLALTPDPGSRLNDGDVCGPLHTPVLWSQRGVCVPKRPHQAQHESCSTGGVCVNEHWLWSCMDLWTELFQHAPHDFFVSPTPQMNDEKACVLKRFHT